MIKSINQRKPADLLRRKPILDSGASVSLFRSPTKSVSKSYQEGSSERVQLAANEAQAKSLGEGTLNVGNVLLNSCVHVERPSNTLFSGGYMCDAEQIVALTKTEVFVVDLNSNGINRDAIISIFHRSSRSRLYKTDMLPAVKLVSSLVKTVELWHRHLVHTGKAVIKKLHHFALNFVQPLGTLEPCHGCFIGKESKRPFKSHVLQANVCGEVIHSDVAGLLPKAAKGEKYSVRFGDQFSRYTRVACIRHKSNVASSFNAY